MIERIREATADERLAAEVAKRLEERLAQDRKTLKTERHELPKLIARLSAEGRRLVETIVQVTSPARRLLQDRIQELGEELGRREKRLAEVERELAFLDKAEIDAQWVARALADFDGVWGVLTAHNRGRLVRALVKEVLVDEPGGTITVTLLVPWEEEDNGAKGDLPQQEDRPKHESESPEATV